MSDELARAAAEGDLERLKQQMRSGKYDPSGRKAQDAVVHAAKGQELEALRALLDWGAPPGAVEATTDLRALLVAAGNGSKDIVQLLLARKGDPREADKKGATAMTRAIAGPHLDVVKELIKSGVEAPEDGDVPGLAKIAFEAKIEMMTTKVAGYASLKVDPKQISQVEDKVWLAMREHMRLIEMHEEQRAGAMLLKLESSTRSEEEEIALSERKVERFTENLRQSRVVMEKEQSDLRALVLACNDLKAEEAVLGLADAELHDEIRERQNELTEEQRIRDKTKMACQSQRGSNDEVFAEIKALEAEITSSSSRKTKLRGELEAAQDELARWLQDRNTAAELTAQAHKILGH